MNMLSEKFDGSRRPPLLKRTTSHQRRPSVKRKPSTSESIGGSSTTATLRDSAISVDWHSPPADSDTFTDPKTEYECKPRRRSYSLDSSSYYLEDNCPVLTTKHERNARVAPHMQFYHPQESPFPIPEPSYRAPPRQQLPSSVRNTMQSDMTAFSRSSMDRKRSSSFRQSWGSSTINFNNEMQLTKEAFSIYDLTLDPDKRASMASDITLDNEQRASQRLSIPRCSSPSSIRASTISMYSQASMPRSPSEDHPRRRRDGEMPTLSVLYAPSVYLEPDKPPTVRRSNGLRRIRRTASSNDLRSNDKRHWAVHHVAPPRPSIASRPPAAPHPAPTAPTCATPRAGPRHVATSPDTRPATHDRATSSHSAGPSRPTPRHAATSPEALHTHFRQASDVPSVPPRRSTTRREDSMADFNLEMPPARRPRKAKTPMPTAQSHGTKDLDHLPSKSELRARELQSTPTPSLSTASSTTLRSSSSSVDLTGRTHRRPSIDTSGALHIRSSSSSSSITLAMDEECTPRPSLSRAKSSSKAHFPLLRMDLDTKPLPPTPRSSTTSIYSIPNPFLSPLVDVLDVPNTAPLPDASAKAASPVNLRRNNTTGSPQCTVPSTEQPWRPAFECKPVHVVCSERPRPQRETVARQSFVAEVVSYEPKSATRRKPSRARTEEQPVPRTSAASSTASGERRPQHARQASAPVGKAKERQTIRLSDLEKSSRTSAKEIRLSDLGKSSRELAKEKEREALSRRAGSKHTRVRMYQEPAPF